MKKILILVLGLFMLNMTTYAYGFGFKKNTSNLQPEIGMYKEILNKTSSYYVGNSQEKTLYLTFDAGYDNGNMEKILDILKEKDVKATFFLTGDFFKYEDLVKRMVDENHIVGNHTYKHKNITKINIETLKEELGKVEEKYKEITGKEMIKYFRPPEGEFDEVSLKNVSSLGYTTFFWSLAYNDWNVNKQKGFDYAYNNIMSNLHNGAIILLHSVSNDNVLCLGSVIDEARNSGYTFKNLDEFKK